MKALAYSLLGLEFIACNIWLTRFNCRRFDRIEALLRETRADLRRLFS